MAAKKRKSAGAGASNDKRGWNRRVVRMLEEIELPADGTSLFVRPSIKHRLETDYMGFANSEYQFGEGIVHRFDVTLERELFEIQFHPDDSADAPDTWRWLRDAYGVVVHADAEAERSLDNDQVIWLAYLDVCELPTHMFVPRGDWFDILDAAGDTARAAIELIEDLVAHPQRFGIDYALLGGALLWPRMLAVHPKVRGQEIGLRLLAHALWTLHRSESDVVLLEAAAVQSAYDATKPVQDTASFEGLCRYYGRLGFRRWREPHDERPLRNVMWMSLGAGHIRAFDVNDNRLI